MPGPNKAAIDVDAALERPLAELSAVEFLQVLAHPTVGGANLGILADKKKYELWVEEGTIGKISVGELLKRIRGEKKKIEYEVPPWIRFFEDPARATTDYGRLVEDVASRVQERIGR